MKRLAALLALALVGCALLQPPTPKPAALLPGEVRSAQAARDTLSIGKSTKAQVRAALGQAVVVDFHSGYEVWVYREKPPEKAPSPTSELVLLFEPSGILTKTRIR